ncbi:dynactin Arp1 p62 subunit RO2 [Coccidioides immitis RS]|uniref:Dynactin subunit 4 n=1 Tax=Coccidioides immitis (strain RS) TaxID=246410 RepID=J3KC15_COCIM|nr:dynactin Arp1 p62 subunit RO2 [Coccidioides immitis RS]EAS32729.3 dynactin Arp1 p62 subunit RO2 [Coccidioides immitis RS]
MARPLPYTFISCPCAEIPLSGQPTNRLSRDLSSLSLARSDDDDDEKTFDPRSPRANYSLYPPEHLLYCEDCHQIKCPRCITEEIVCWYCPNCLFETPSSMVKSEGNRCTRNCFNCPICTSPLAVSTVGNGDGNGSSQNGPWILTCSYCMWTTLDIGIKFDKPTNIRSQLSSIFKGTDRRESIARPSHMRSPLSSFSSLQDIADGPSPQDEHQTQGALSEDSQSSLNHDARFAALKSFYRSQLAETTSSPDPLIGPELGSYSSPSALSRIMSLYASGLGGLHGSGAKKAKSRPPVMREALTQSEGLHIPPAGAESATVQKMATEGWDGLASMEQRLFQLPGTRFVDDLCPLPAFLRTKRSKRCKACKHILVKPEFKPQSTRFRIRLIAISYIPLTNLRPIVPLPPTPPVNLDALEPFKPVQLLLTLKNHMFDPIRVTLATPSVTPGRVASRVTILCPEFEVGANTDVWDEALQSSSAPDPRSSRSGVEKVAEAGKVWDKGRNWSTVAMEVVPGSLADLGESGLTEDEDILEIPIFVRLEWEAEGVNEGLNLSSKPGSKKTDVEMVKRELAYWTVLGVGRIVASGAGER